MNIWKDYITYNVVCSEHWPILIHFISSFTAALFSIHKRMSRTGCRAPFKLRSVTLDISKLMTFSKVMFCELICLKWKVFWHIIKIHTVWVFILVLIFFISSIKATKECNTFLQNTSVGYFYTSSSIISIYLFTIITIEQCPSDNLSSTILCSKCK